MIEDILSHVSKELQEYAREINNPYCLGKKVIFNYKEKTNKTKIVLLGLNLDKEEKNKYNSIRKQLYQLKLGDWHTQIYDVGDVNAGYNESDTLFAFQEACKYFAKDKSVLVVLGNEGKCIQWQHLALGKKKPVTLCTIDSKIALENSHLPLNSENYLAKIIQSDLNIAHYTNIGYQSYFVPKEELALMNQLGYDYFRLGEIIDNIKQIIPSLRNNNSVAINLPSIQNYYNKEENITSSNGFTSREICDLSYYAGLGNTTQIFGLYNYFKLKTDSSTEALLTQIIWYFIEGVNNRQEEKTFNSAHYEKYTLPFQEKEIIFYRNTLNNNWWVNSNNQNELYPCSYQDYTEAVNDIFTNRIKNILKK